MVQVRISVGELIDKLSILEIKKNKVEDANKLVFINNEHTLLLKKSETFFSDTKIRDLYQELLTVNSDLWLIEDRIRILESLKKFDDEFIDLARKVYFTNDKRFYIKNKINELTNSEIREIKNYKDYK